MADSHAEGSPPFPALACSLNGEEAKTFLHGRLLWMQLLLLLLRAGSVFPSRDLIPWTAG